MIVKGWTRDYLLNQQTYTDAILKRITDVKATIDDGATEFDGIPVNRLIHHLRYDNLKFPSGHYDQRAILSALGFRIIRARPKWSFRDSYQRECEVVTI